VIFDLRFWIFDCQTILDRHTILDCHTAVIHSFSSALVRITNQCSVSSQVIAEGGDSFAVSPPPWDRRMGSSLFRHRSERSNGTDANISPYLAEAGHVVSSIEVLKGGRHALSAPRGRRSTASSARSGATRP
jgi:hypothetical protein